MNSYLCPVVLNRITVLPSSSLSIFGSVQQNIAYEKIKQEEVNFNNISSCLITMIENLVPLVEDSERKNLISIKRRVYNKKNINNYDSCVNKVQKQILKYRKSQHQITDLKKVYITVWNSTKNLENEAIDTQMLNLKQDLFYAPKFIGATITERIEKYLSTNIEDRSRSQKKTNIILSKLITRAAAKTSPFSTLTGSYFSKISTSLNDTGDNSINKKYKTISKLNSTLLYRILYKSLRLDSVVLIGHFYLEPTIITNEEYCFWTTTIDDENNKKIFKTIDTLNKQKKKKILTIIISQFKDKIFTFREFNSNAQITKILSDIEYRKEIFKTLIAHQFIVKETEALTQSQNLLEESITILKNKRNGFSYEENLNIIEPLIKIEPLMKQYDSLNPKDQFSLHAEIYKYIEQICDFLNIQKFDSKEIIYQDFISETIDHENINTNHIEELKDLMNFYNIFNTTYYFKRLIGENFYNEYGDEKISIKQNWRGLTKNILDVFLKNVSLWSDQLTVTHRKFEIRELNELQQAKNTVLEHFIESCKGSDSININKDFVQRILKLLPTSLFKSQQSNDFFVQIDSQRNKVIVNHFYEGNLMYMLRFIEENKSIQQDKNFVFYINNVLKKRKLADIPATFGFNANNRYVYTDNTVSIFNNEKGNDASKNLEFTNLTATFDKNSRNILFKKDDESIISPLFLGTLIPVKLPGLVSAISILSRDFSIYTDISQLIIDICIKNNSDDEIISIPEVSFEKYIILSRLKFAIKTSILKCIKDDFYFFEYFLNNNLPSKFFAFPYVAIDKESGSKVDIKKPQYIDLSSPVLVKIFSQLLMKSSYIIIEEINPNIAYKKNNIEKIIELTRV